VTPLSLKTVSPNNGNNERTPFLFPSVHATAWVLSSILPANPTCIHLMLSYFPLRNKTTRMSYAHTYIMPLQRIYIAWARHYRRECSHHGHILVTHLGLRIPFDCTKQRSQQHSSTRGRTASHNFTLAMRASTSRVSLTTTLSNHFHLLS
jgi:hypothetical protein